MSRQFKFQQNPTRITGTLCEDQYTYFIIFRSVLLRIGNVLDKIVKNIKTQFIFSNLFENRAFYETIWGERQYFISRETARYNETRFSRSSCMLPKATITQPDYVTHFFSNTKIVTRILLNSTLYGHRLVLFCLMRLTANRTEVLEPYPASMCVRHNSEARLQIFQPKPTEFQLPFILLRTKPNPFKSNPAYRTVIAFRFIHKFQQNELLENILERKVFDKLQR